MLRSMILSPTPPLIAVMNARRLNRYEIIFAYLRWTSVMWCALGYWTCLRRDERGRRRDRARQIAERLPAAVPHRCSRRRPPRSPAGCLAGSGSSTVASSQRVLEHGLRHAVHEQVLFDSTSASSTALVHGLPADVGRQGRVSRRPACPDRRRSGTFRPRRTSRAPGRRDRTSGGTLLHGRGLLRGRPPAPARSACSSIIICALTGPPGRA